MVRQGGGGLQKVDGRLLGALRIPCSLAARNAASTNHWRAEAGAGAQRRVQARSKGQRADTQGSTAACWQHPGCWGRSGQRRTGACQERGRVQGEGLALPGSCSACRPVQPATSRRRSCRAAASTRASVPALSWQPRRLSAVRRGSTCAHPGAAWGALALAAPALVLGAAGWLSARGVLVPAGWCGA